MNSLSWMIYWAGVVGSINNALLAITTVSSLGAFIGGLGWAIEGSFDNHERAGVCVRFARKAIIAAAISLVIAIPIPSSNSIYAIAASEAGERAITSETGKKAVKALDVWLDKQIGEPKK